MRRLDDELARQVRETRATVLDRLAEAPDDLRALFLARVVADVDPDRDGALRAAARRFARARRALGAAWPARGRELGVDVLLFNLCEQLRRIGNAATLEGAFARRIAEVTATPVILALLRDRLRELRNPPGARRLDAALRAIDARVADGLIDASFLPGELRGAATFHPSGHLARVHVPGDRKRHGELTLEARYGAGRLAVTGHRGGSGFAIDERYADGRVRSTFYSPWHDGEESSAAYPWARWVAESLRALADVAVESAGALG